MRFRSRSFPSHAASRQMHALRLHTWRVSAADGKALGKCESINLVINNVEHEPARDLYAI
jgi:hypothetical protein